MRLISQEEVRQYPHNAVLSLEVTFSKEKEAEEKIERTGKGKEKEKKKERETEEKASSQRGTGFYIGGNYVLTAAHVVVNEELGLPTKIKCYVSRHDSQPTIIYAHKYAFPRLYLEFVRKELQKALKQHPGNQPEFNVQRRKVLEGVDALLEGSDACHDYALLYLDKPLDVQPIIPVASYYYTDTNNDSLCDPEVMLCGYPSLDYRFSKLIRSFEYADANIEMIRLDSETFTFTPLHSNNAVKGIFSPPLDSIGVGDLNKDEDNREKILKRIFTQGHQRGLYPAIGLTPYEVEASLVRKTMNLMEFNMPSYHGMSGSPIRFVIQPIYANHQPVWYASAILSKGNKRLAVGCRFTQEKIDAIRRWKKTILQLTPQSISGSMHDDDSVIFRIIEEEDKDLPSRVMEGVSGMIDQSLSSASSFIDQGLSALSSVESFFKT